MNVVAPARYRLPGARPALAAAGGVQLLVARTGHIMYFFGTILVSLPTAVRRYRKEFMRLLADVTWGNGSIVVGGGTVGVALVLGATAGALLGLEGYNALNLLGLGPATGLISSFAGTRELAPIMIGLAFCTQAGCRFTAQLGAMRINEEIDAMDVLGINSIAYLVATRAAAAIVAAVPLFFACLALTYLSTQLVVYFAAGQSSGTYLHYFALVMNGRDVAFATVKAVIFVFVGSTLQCYYGYYASGGPAGVGVAAGRAMRSAITIVIVLNMLLTMAMWGVDAGARFGG